MKVTKTKNAMQTKDANCRVFDPADDSHVKRVSPMDTKAKQMKSADELGINERRETSTSRKRADKETKPL